MYPHDDGGDPPGTDFRTGADRQYIIILIAFESGGEVQTETKINA